MPQGGVDFLQVADFLNKTFGIAGQPKQEKELFKQDQANKAALDEAARAEGYTNAAHKMIHYDYLLRDANLASKQAETGSVNQGTKESNLNIDKLGLPPSGFNAQTSRMSAESGVKNDTTQRTVALHNLANDMAGRKDVSKIGGTDFSTPEGASAYGVKGRIGAEKTTGQTQQASALSDIMKGVAFMSPEQQQSTFKALEAIGFPGAAQLLAPFKDAEAQKAAALEFLKRGGKGASVGVGASTPASTNPSKPTGYIAPGSSGGPGGAPSSFLSGLVTPQAPTNKPTTVQGLAQLLQSSQGGTQNITNQGGLQLDPALLQMLIQQSPTWQQNPGYGQQQPVPVGAEAGNNESPIDMLKRLASQNWPKY